MARKRASMREGPLAELFRATEAAQRGEGDDQSADDPLPPAAQVGETDEIVAFAARERIPAMYARARLAYSKFPLQAKRSEEDGTLLINVTRVDFFPSLTAIVTG